jgi:hypothetical protein
MIDRQFTPEEIADATQKKYQRLAEAMRMVREAVETSMGAASGLAASEQFPTAYEECEAIAHAIAKFAAGRVKREPVNTVVEVITKAQARLRGYCEAGQPTNTDALLRELHADLGAKPVLDALHRIGA